MQISERLVTATAAGEGHGREGERISTAPVPHLPSPTASRVSMRSGLTGTPCLRLDGRIARSTGDSSCSSCLKVDCETGEQEAAHRIVDLRERIAVAETGWDVPASDWGLLVQDVVHAEP